MRQTDLIQRQAELVAVTIESRVRRLHDALEDLSLATRHAFATRAVSDDELRGWLDRERFEALPTGFFESAERIDRARATGPLAGEMVMCWAATERGDLGVARRLYLVKGVAPMAAAMHARLKGVAWAYFQDAGSRHASAVIPGLAPDAMIPSDFDWHAYHSFTIVAPGVNPERATRWSPPNVDYGGEGLISCVSTPVWEGDRFLGVWTMDVRLASLHADLTLDALGAAGERQASFIVDYDGRLLAHPDLDPGAQGEKGAVYDHKLATLGGDFAALDVAALAAAGHGQMELRDAKGERLHVVYRAIPAIRWVAFVALPAADLIEASRDAFQRAFARLGAGDLSFRLEGVGDGVMQALVGSYNEMAETLQESLRRREQAEAERRRLEREQERLARELEIAATIQMSMLPRAPRHEGFEFAGRMRPADEVGGDFYDVVARPGGALWVTIGDVSSHGLGAGLVMMVAQAAFRAVFEARPEMSADEALRRVNRLVHANASTRMGGGRYLTGMLLAHRGDGAFDCVGGHLWPLVFDAATGAARRVEVPGPWLAVVPELPVVPVTRLELAPGEVLCLYSDGIIEARDAGGEMYDLERLIESVSRGLRAGCSLDDVATGVLDAVSTFAPAQDDDRTVLLVRRA